jgi:hypothetical protein
MSVDITSLQEGAIAINEMVKALQGAGFSREESIRFAAIYLAEQGRNPERGDDGK